MSAVLPPPVGVLSPVLGIGVAGSTGGISPPGGMVPELLVSFGGWTWWPGNAVTLPLNPCLQPVVASIAVSASASGKTILFSFIILLSLNLLSVNKSVGWRIREILSHLAQAGWER